MRSKPRNLGFFKVGSPKHIWGKDIAQYSEVETLEREDRSGLAT